MYFDRIGYDMQVQVVVFIDKILFTLLAIIERVWITNYIYWKP
jgi:hypothetical protein